MKLAALFLLAAASFHFDITDARGKKPPGVTVEARDADPDGWHELRLVNKGKGSPVLIWPFDSKAKIADGPGDIPVIVIETGDPKALTNTRVVAALVAGELLGASAATGLDPVAVAKAAAALSAADEPFARGVGLLSAKKPADAVRPRRPPTSRRSSHQSRQARGAVAFSSIPSLKTARTGPPASGTWKSADSARPPSRNIRETSYRPGLRADPP